LAGNADISPALRSAIGEILDSNKAGIRLLGAKADLSLKNIEDKEAKQIAKELADNSTVTTLLLCTNCMGNRVFAAIASALVKNRTLTSIWLDNNDLSDEGASTVAAVLRENSILLKISLNGNRIGPRGAAALAEALCVNTYLQLLRLGQNCIGNDGVTALAEALVRNSALSTLDLRCNVISDDGVMVILDSLKQHNVSLSALFLEGNPKISPALGKDIDFVLTSRRVLRSLLKHLHKPLEKRLIPLVVRSVQLDLSLALSPCSEAAAGPIFYLLRTNTSIKSKAIRRAAKGCLPLLMGP
jgi:Leucine Rich repeat